jgi:ATP-binding cassette subfamily F protein 3
LDNVTTKTVEVTQGQLITYEGNYSFYLEEKELRKEIQNGAYENQQAKIRQTERFIERFKAKATKARQVQSRVKALDKLDLIEEVVDDTAAVNFRFRFKQQPGRYIITLKDVSKAYGNLEILKNSNATIERGDKIVLIGANGKGKSTLLRIISGTEPIEGERALGYNVIQGFFAQHQLESLKLDNEIIEEMKQAGSGKTEQELRNVLGCFLFSDDDQYKKIKVLSGGEKSRVALAKTLISEANFLLLDEPTNHLDFISENILIQALQQYEGSFVVVSHNRHFVSQVANKIWYIEDKQIKEYPGTYDEYEYWRKQQAAITTAPVKTQVAPKVEKKQEVPKNDSNQNRLKSLEKEMKKVEADMETLQKQKEVVELKMTDPSIFGNFNELQKLQQELAIITQKLEMVNKKWDELAETIDTL